MKGETITVAASPTPHAEILEVAQEILAAKDITLDIQVYNDYVVPNLSLIHILAEGGAADREDIKYLGVLPVFNADGSIKCCLLYTSSHRHYGI